MAKSPVGLQRLARAAPPRATVIRCLRPDGDLSFHLRPAPELNVQPILRRHCPVFCLILTLIAHAAPTLKASRH